MATPAWFISEQKKAVLDWSFPLAVPTQAIRACQAARITADFFHEPYLVGGHWFICGDFDSPEREANRGLVRSDGRPWDELVRELKAVHEAGSWFHSGGHGSSQAGRIYATAMALLTFEATYQQPLFRGSWIESGRINCPPRRIGV